MQQQEEEIDGGLLEGGGQVIRNCMAYAALRGRGGGGLKIHSIRAGRPNPGLQQQHLTGALLVSAMSANGQLSPCQVGSTELKFVPGDLRSGDFSADIKSAGSVALLIQSVLPCAIFAPGPCVFKLKGGTNTTFAPHIDYLQLVTLPILARMGVVCDIELQRRGFFPKGCGLVVVRTQPTTAARGLQPIILDTRGELTRVWGRVFVSSMVDANAHHVADVMTRALRAATAAEAAVPAVTVVIEVEVVPAAAAAQSSPAFGVVLLAETTTGCLFGASAVESGYGKRDCLAPETVAQSAVRELLEDWRAGGCADRHLQDQLIIFMALARGRSRVRLGTMELHTQTAIHFAQQLAGATFNIHQVEKEEGGGFVVECDGIGKIAK
jgi:RNA 3'-terminal phosphate cyclase (ATP)